MIQSIIFMCLCIGSIPAIVITMIAYTEYGKIKPPHSNLWALRKVPRIISLVLLFILFFTCVFIMSGRIKDDRVAKEKYELVQEQLYRRIY